MKKLIIIAAAALVLCAGYWIAHGFFGAMQKGGRQSSSSQLDLAQIAKQANETLPKQVDDNTRLDKEIAGPGNRMTYQYTLLKLSVSQINTNKFTASVKAELIKSLKTRPELARYRDGHVELQYEYRDKSGQPISSILVTPSDL